MGQLIDGRALAAEHEHSLAQTILHHDGSIPTLVSFCNEFDPASVKYTQMKSAKAGQLGIKFITELISSQTTTPQLLAKIAQYNNDPTVHGIMIQMPLPSELEKDQQTILNSIDPSKDVDGLTEKGQQFFMPATVKAVISLLEAADPTWPTKKIGVAGSTGEVGRPLMEVFHRRGVNAVGATRHVGDITKDFQDCDILISSTGANNLIKPDMVKPGFIAIDVGLGDFDPATIAKSSQYTPKTGGVGPMTVISLMENVVKSAHGD